MSHPPYDSTGAQELDGDDWSAAEGRFGRRAAFTVAAAVGGALLLGGTGYAVGTYLGSGGPQPEDVLPADTVAMARFDFDPSADQKIALFSLLSAFPDLVPDDEDLAGAVLEPVLADLPGDLAFDRDVRPWLGDRVAVAAVPDPDDGVTPVLVLAVTDEQAMTATLEQVREDTGAGFAVRDGFVLVTDSQETADRLAADEDRLAGDEEFAADLDALDGDQIAVAWADLSAVQDLAEAAGALPPAELGAGTEELSGRIVLGVHADPDALEIEGRTSGTTSAPAALGGTAGTDPTRLVLDLPEDTLAAVSASGIGTALADAYAQGPDGGPLAGFEDAAAALGLALPDDLRTLFGTDLALAVLGSWEMPAVGVRVDTDDPRRATELVAGLSADPELGLPLVSSLTDDGYVVAVDPETADALADGGGGLGNTASFRSAVPEAGDAGLIAYLRVGGLLDQLVAAGEVEAEDAARFDAVDALGLSASTDEDGDGRFVLRITTG